MLIFRRDCQYSNAKCEIDDREFAFKLDDD